MTARVLEAERRELSRFALETGAVLRVGATTASCRLRDISLGGALVSLQLAAVRARPGDRCTLTVRLDESTAVIQLHGTIAHARADAVGIACRETDLDSFRHLRRILELNLGSEKLVRGELGALARQRRTRAT